MSAETTETDEPLALDETWVAALVKASAAVAPGLARSGLVEFSIAKSQTATVAIEDGRVTGLAGTGEPDVSIPTTGDQLRAFMDGTESLAQAYIRGDLKPVGSIGVFLAVVELFEDPGFRSALAG